jgi:DNA-binding CsgD family transcriptional regulator
MEASRLSPDDEGTQRRYLQGLMWTVFRGDAATAATFANDVATFAPGPLRDAVLGAMATVADDPETAQRLLTEAWREIGPNTDPEIAATVATAMGIHRYGRLDAAGTVDWCKRALSRTAPDSALHAVAMTYLVHGLGYAGRTADAAAAAEDQTGRLWLNPRSARGVLRLVEDDLPGARADLASVATTASRLGILNTAAFGFAYLARAEWVLGDWDSSVVHAERAVAINLESDFGFMQSAVVGIAVLVAAGRGEWATAEEYLRTMEAGGTGYERSKIALGMSRARVGEARGDPAAVLAALDPIRHFDHHDAAGEPGFWNWPDLYADALVATGRGTEADEFLGPHEERAAARDRRLAVARLARSRGRTEAALGRLDRAEEAFARALAATEGLPAPFERARIELAAGAVLRRAGQRRRAADLLGAAEERFTALGARPYAERCAKELAASGLHPASRRSRNRAELTAQELVVARLAANGRSNRELADELVVSIKTIEYHLRNAFQKLGVTSRKQLAARLAELDEA